MRLCTACRKDQYIKWKFLAALIDMVPPFFSETAVFFYIIDIMKILLSLYKYNFSPSSQTKPYQTTRKSQYDKEFSPRTFCVDNRNIISYDKHKLETTN